MVRGVRNTTSRIGGPFTGRWHRQSDPSLCMRSPCPPCACHSAPPPPVLCVRRSSNDLVHWRYLGFAYPPGASGGNGTTYEMPEMFTLHARTAEAIVGSSADPRPTTLSVFKAGLKTGVDYWATGAYDESSHSFTIGRGSSGIEDGSRTQACDYGKFYASKSFVAADGRRVLIGWVGEDGGPLREWSGVQSIPRVVSIDAEHAGRVQFWPVAEVESLRSHPPRRVPPSVLPPGSALVARDGGRMEPIQGAQLDLIARFSGWATERHTHGPRTLTSFGLGCLGGGANATISIWQDEMVSMATLRLGPHSGDFPLPRKRSTPISLRVLVDRSVVEAFASGGRAVITHRLYKSSLAAHDSAVSILNTGETPIQLDAMEAHTMKQVLRDAAAMDQIQLTLQRDVSQHTANGADTA